MTHSWFNVLPIPLLHQFKLLELIHKFYYHNHLLTQIFQGYFTTNNSMHQYSTRNKHNLHISTVNSSMGQRCSIYRGSKYWNDLSDYFKSISSVFLFKRNIKNYLLWRWLHFSCCRYCSYLTRFKSIITLFWVLLLLLQMLCLMILILVYSYSFNVVYFVFIIYYLFWIFILHSLWSSLLIIV